LAKRGGPRAPITPTGHPEGSTETAEQRSCDLDGVRLVLQQHRELVPAEPRERVRIGQSLPEAPGDLRQEVAARVVPKAVIDRLETIEVQEADGQRAPVAAVQLQGMGCAVDEQGPVGEPGQRVVERRVAQLGLSLG
jgi:hypothetical protein